MLFDFKGCYNLSNIPCVCQPVQLEMLSFLLNFLVIPDVAFPALPCSSHYFCSCSTSRSCCFAHIPCVEVTSTALALLIDIALPAFHVFNSLALLLFYLSLILLCQRSKCSIHYYCSCFTCHCCCFARVPCLEVTNGALALLVIDIASQAFHVFKSLVFLLFYLSL